MSAVSHSAISYIDNQIGNDRWRRKELTRPGNVDSPWLSVEKTLSNKKRRIKSLSPYVEWSEKHPKKRMAINIALVVAGIALIALGLVAACVFPPGLPMVGVALLTFGGWISCAIGARRLILPHEEHKEKLESQVRGIENLTRRIIANLEAKKKDYSEALGNKGKQENKASLRRVIDDIESQLQYERGILGEGHED